VSWQHNGQAVTLAAGDMILVDPRLAYTCRYAADSELLVVKYPRRNLLARIGSVEAFVGSKLAADVGVGGLLSEFLSVLPAHADRLDGAAVHASSQILDLLAVLLLKESGGSAPRIGFSRLLLAHRLRTAIETSLTDPTATAASIARSAGISLRYANAILNEYDTSVSRLLQTRRLERCRQALANPLCKPRSISTIAYAWGFSDLTHFTRRFRLAYGLVPSEYRKQQAVK
jgi:AraC family transcriptional regulator, positive regulator of tynA and feaB